MMSLMMSLAFCWSPLVLAGTWNLGLNEQSGSTGINTAVERRDIFGV